MDSVILTEQMQKPKVSQFSQKVYDLISTVPKGKITTYKLIAEKLNTKAYRAVGQSLRCNPFAPEVPCHRVVTTSGEIGGFMGKKTGPSLKKKINLLKNEGVIIKNRKVVDFEKKKWKF